MTYAGHPEPKFQEVRGRFVNGQGNAGPQTQRDVERYRALFGCQMIGTFNIRLKAALERDPATPAQEVSAEGAKYYLCKICRAEDLADWVYGYYVRWPRGEEWRPSMGTLEVYSKDLIPDRFKTGELVVHIFEKLTPAEIAEYSRPLYWFQSFPWSAKQRADSDLVWSVLEGDDYEGRTVLDYGCNTGRYAIEAAKRGGIVTGIDPAPEIIERAQYTCEMIDQQDARFKVGSHPPVQRFDIVFCMSVLHQIDPYYCDLTKWVKRLKAITDQTLWLELIYPSIKGRMSLEQIGLIVGEKPVKTYKHKVRLTRAIFRIDCRDTSSTMEHFTDATGGVR